MCLFDHSFAHNIFVFHFVAKRMLEFRENMICFRIVLKSSNYSNLSSSFFASAEVVTEFSGAWCLSIVGQAAKATYGVHEDGQELKRANLYTSNGLGRIVTMTTGTLLFKLTFFLHIDYTRTRTLQLCFVSQY